jgi:hypothetical protein
VTTLASFVSIVIGSLLIASPVGAQHPDKATQLHQDMRKLWTDHTVWTRDYIVAAVDDRPDAQAAASRLMRNQEDIGNAVAAYYGRAAGQQLTSRLKQHISIAVDLIKAAKAGDQAAQKLASISQRSSARRTPTGRVACSST